MDPSDPHDLRNTAEAAIETEHIGVAGMGAEDSASRVVALLKKVDGVRDAHVENGSGVVKVTFDARKTHVPALHDALLAGGYHPGAIAD